MSEEILTPEEWEELFAETELEPAPPVFAYTNTDPYFKLQNSKSFRTRNRLLLWYIISAKHFLTDLSFRKIKIYTRTRQKIIFLLN